MNRTARFCFPPFNARTRINSDLRATALRSKVAQQLLWILLAAVSAAVPNVAHARDLKFGVRTSFDSILYPEFSGHGDVVVALRVPNLPRTSELTAIFNTETLDLSLAGIDLGKLPIELRVGAKGEAFYAGLLPDYYRDAKLDASRGFAASYAEVNGAIKLGIRRNFLELQAAGKYLFFGTAPQTDKNFVLPESGPLGELRLRYTWWGVAPDPSFREFHRPYYRVSGFAFGAELGVDLRGNTEPWGMRDPEAGALLDDNNTPSAVASLASAWLRAGTRLGGRARWQSGVSGRFAVGQDDVNRARLGGMNPYSILLPGIAWAAYVSPSYVAGDAALLVRVGQSSEIGWLAAAAAVDQRSRNNTPAVGALVGTGPVVDVRLKKWQIDFRAGWSPWPGAGSAGAVGAMFGFGYGNAI